MKYKLTTEQKAALDDALGALQPFYDPGDDGDAVRVALNAIAGVLGERIEIEVAKDDSLNGVLDILDAEGELREAIVELYEIAKKGAYGEGLTKKGADRINDLVEEIEGPLTVIIRNGRPKTSARIKVRGRSSARSRKS